MLREMDTVLREATGLPISIAEDPLFCVVMGTGRCLEELKTLRHVLIGA
jgi:rod shape-determining protein MreB